MDPDYQHDLIVADRPFWTTRESLDDQQSLSSVSFARGDFSIARHRRDRPNLGISNPNPQSAMFMAVITLRDYPNSAVWRNGHFVKTPGFPTGSLACLDLRDTWTVDLSSPFDSVHAYIPLSAFDEITSELKRPKIEQLSCSNLVHTYDETIFGLVRALNDVMARPQEQTSLFTDHIFAAMVTHLAVNYGGLGDAGVLLGSEAKRRGTLTRAQQKRVKSRLLDDVKDSPNLAELAELCGVSRSHFMRAFKETTGVPPHRWLMIHRVNRAREMIIGSQASIGEIALECGFADQSHLTRVFSRIFGRTPGALRRETGE